MNISSQNHDSLFISSYLTPFPGKVDEQMDEKIETSHINDLEASIDFMFQSFTSWHVIQDQGIATISRIREVQDDTGWHMKYNNRFTLLHNGKSCKHSTCIGRGRYSKVYKFGKRAYKVIKISDNMEERFNFIRCNIRELGMFHAMNHTSVVHPISSQLVMKHGSMVKIIHEMKKARMSLDDLIIGKKELIGMSDIIHALRGCALGLAYMHNNDIIHGDIKPANVLLDASYNSLITDFTLTNFVGRSHDISFGTLYWRSPECLLQKSYSKASDVWSFGVLILDCLYGTHYMDTVLGIHDNRDALKKLTAMIGKPNDSWCDENCEMLKSISEEDRDIWKQRLREHECTISVEKSEHTLLHDLINKILVWDESKRITMSEILLHPLFQIDIKSFIEPEKRKPISFSFQSNILGKVDVLKAGEVELRWRTPTEKEQLRLLVKTFYLKTFGSELVEDCLLRDIVVMVKRLSDRFRIIESSFDIDHVVKISSEFNYFLWKNYTPENVMFECELYHIVTCLKYNIFPLVVKEKNLFEELIKEETHSFHKLRLF